MNKKLSNMKRIYSILLLLAFAWGAQAQIAGPDKHVVREVDNSQTVTLGVPDASPDACYIWTGDHIVGNPNQPVITVNPRSEAEDYHVKKISQNGIEEDEAWVFLDDSVEISTVKAKYGCYNHGDNITVDQFEITTYPEGYENLVTVSPAVAQNSNGWSNDNVELTFTLMKDGHRSTKKINVKVINSDLTVTQGLPAELLSARQRVENMNKVRQALTDLKSSTDKMKFLKNVPGSPCSWNDDPPAQAGLALSITPKKLCCSDHTENWALQVQFGQLTYGASFGCRVPFYGIPHIASADLVCNFGGSVAVGPIDGIMALNSNCNQLCIPVTLSLFLNGGVGVALGGKVLTADLLLQGSVMEQASWCPFGTANNIKIGATLSVVGQVTLASCITYSIEKPIATVSQTIEL